MDKEFVLYIKSKPGLKRLMEALKDKYVSIGRFSGSVVINNISKNESADLSNFLGKRVGVSDNLRVTYNEVNKKINESKFKNISWGNVFNLYFEKEILPKKVILQNTKLEEENFYKKILDFNINNEVLNVIKKRYRKSKVSIGKELNNILLLIDNIPKTPTLLPIYASITGNPHFLDINTPSSNLFLRVLCFIMEAEYPKNNYDKINLLTEINVYTDPYSNYVITYKLTGNKILNECSNVK